MQHYILKYSLLSRGTMSRVCKKSFLTLVNIFQA